MAVSSAYLRAVYGADEPVEQLRLAELSFFYRVAATAKVLQPLCAVGGKSGCTGVCAQPQPSSPWHGGSTWPAAPSQRRCSTMEPAQQLGRHGVFVSGCSTAANESRRHQAADHEWLEVMRLPSPIMSRTPSTPQVRANSSSTHTANCWFWVARGSGVFLNVGRSLRASTPSAAARALGIGAARAQIRADIEHPASRRLAASAVARQRQRVPAVASSDGDRTTTAAQAGVATGWMRRAGDEWCGAARARGFDTIQIGRTWPDWQLGFGAQVIVCSARCASQRTCGSCPAGVALRTGVAASRPCACNGRCVVRW